jgi:hypothetical protein
MGADRAGKDIVHILNFLSLSLSLSLALSSALIFSLQTNDCCRIMLHEHGNVPKYSRMKKITRRNFGIKIRLYF